MVKEHHNRQRSIKSKLMAAVSMLLVSTIMLVSSTYAWFTLSTAPEVTGIQTAVGANGNLEMALMPTSGSPADIKSQSGDGMLGQVAKNITWGNLVDLSVQADVDQYGLSKITLYPSKLNAATSDDKGNPETLAVALLQTPEYGADGRVSGLVAKTMTATYDTTNTNFPSSNAGYGVRAVGVASGMTDRQLDYRNARSAANTAKEQVKTLASQSLNTNGSTLANVAIKKGTEGDAAVYTAADVLALWTIVDDLQGTGTEKGALDYIETAYMQYILAYAASSAGGEDTAWSAVKGAVEAQDATLDSVLTVVGRDNLPAELKTAIAQFETTKSNVADAAEALPERPASADDTTTYTWAQINTALYKLANPDEMLINGIKAKEVMDKASDLMNSVAGSGLVVKMSTGGGVYADIADQCGDYTASVTIEEVKYGGLSLKNMNARMETDSSLKPNYYLVAVGNYFTDAMAPSSDTTADLPITDMYGYIIDLAFRTNAAESNLQLQVDPKDRIYGTQTSNEDTMGGGSSMTFKAVTTDFSNTQIQALMRCIRVVFYTPGSTNTVLATAKLNVDKNQITADGITAPMYIYEKTTAGGTTTSYLEATYIADDTAADGYRTINEGETATHAKNSVTGEYVAATVVAGATEGEYVAPTGEQKATHAVVTVTSEGNETAVANNTITALTQNQATPVSVLVYLDGESITNADVANAASSMTGSMNLQFASSAALVPMEYAALHIDKTDSSNNSSNSSNNNTATTYDVTVPAGVTGEAKATANTAYTFTVATGYTLGEVTVGGTAVTPTAGENGAYTIPADKVTGAIVINATANG